MKSQSPPCLKRTCQGVGGESGGSLPSMLGPGRPPAPHTPPSFPYTLLHSLLASVNQSAGCQRGTGSGAWRVMLCCPAPLIPPHQSLALPGFFRCVWGGGGAWDGCAVSHLFPPRIREAVSLDLAFPLFAPAPLTLPRPSPAGRHLSTALREAVPQPCPSVNPHYPGPCPLRHPLPFQLP